MTDFSTLIDNGSGNSGGHDRFDFDAHLEAHLVIFEPKGVRTGVKTKFGASDFTDADITVFDTKAELESMAPGAIYKNAGLGGALGRSLAAKVGRVAVGVLAKVPSDKGNDAKVLNATTNDRVAGAIRYLQKRESEAAATPPAQQSGGDIPAFLQ